jgi:hypothetical protein
MNWGLIRTVAECVVAAGSIVREMKVVCLYVSPRTFALLTPHGIKSHDGT